jgi:hypothetical protein
MSANKSKGAGIIPAHIRYNSALNKDAKYLYAEISAQCDEYGYTDLTDVELAALTGDRPRTVTRHVGILKSLGFVTSKRMIGRRVMTVYQLPNDAKPGEKDIAKNGYTSGDIAKNGYTGIAKNGYTSKDTLYTLSSSSRRETETSVLNNLSEQTPTPLPPAPAAARVESVTAETVTTKLPGIASESMKVSYEGYADMIKADTYFLDAQNMTLKLDVPVVDLLPKFISQRLSAGKPDQGYGEFKMHFGYWLAKQPMRGADKSNSTTSTPTRSSSVASATKKKASWADAYADEQP